MSISLVPSSADIIRAIRQETDTVMLSFSTGKDSIAAWLHLLEFDFKKIIPVYMWAVPGLQFIEDSLRYYERHFKTHIYRVPHPTFYRWLNNFTYQVPERCSVIDELDPPNIGYDQVFGMVAAEEGLNETPWMATGVRVADSPARRASISRYGAINRKRKTFFPVWDWNKATLIDRLTRAKVKLPIDYKWFGRSFDGIDWRFLEPLKKHAPSDYAKVLEWFPLAELDILRKQYAQANS